MKHKMKWIDIVNETGVQVFTDDPRITEHSDFDETKMNPVTLYRHQQLNISAMLQLEQAGQTGIRLAGDHIIKTASGMLTSRFGSGKTFTILGLIASGIQPEHKSVILTYPSMSQRDKLSNYYDIQNDDFRHSKFNLPYTRLCHPTPFRSLPNMTITRIPKKIVRTAIVYISRSVISQWIESVNRTHLKALIIPEGRDIKHFADILKEGAIENYDVVVVSTGDTSVACDVHGFVEPQTKVRNGQIPKIINNLTRNHGITWSRWFFDDYDIVTGDTTHYPTPPCMFAWFVSGTSRMPMTSHVNSTIGVTANKLFDHTDFFGNDFASLPVLNITTNPDNMKSNMQLYPVIGWNYTVPDPHANARRAIREMNAGVAKLLDEDAFNEAASAAGVQCGSVLDIYNHMLTLMTNDHRNALLKVRYLSDLSNQSSWNHTPLVTEPEDINAVNDRIARMMPLTAHYDGILKHISDSQNRYKSILVKYKSVMERIVQNFKSDDCPICGIEYKDLNSSIVLTKCCALVHCYTCCVRGTLKSRECPQCRTGITDFNMLVCITRDFDITVLRGDTFEDSIAAEKLAYTAPSVKVNPEPSTLPILTSDEASSSSEVKIVEGMSKTDVIIGIIKNVKYIREMTRVGASVMGSDIQVDDVHLAQIASLTHRRFLIFIAQDRAREELCSCLTQSGVQWSDLVKKVRSIRNSTLAAFKSGTTNVLVMRSAVDCAGLNFEYVSDVILMSRVIEPEHEQQAIGRLQRLGRDYPAQVHYIRYSDSD